MHIQTQVAIAKQRKMKTRAKDTWGSARVDDTWKEAHTPTEQEEKGLNEYKENTKRQNDEQSKAPTMPCLDCSLVEDREGLAAPSIVCAHACVGAMKRKTSIPCRHFAHVRPARCGCLSAAPSVPRTPLSLDAHARLRDPPLLHSRAPISPVLLKGPGSITRGERTKSTERKKREGKKPTRPLRVCVRMCVPSTTSRYEGALVSLCGRHTFAEGREGKRNQPFAELQRG